jgi:frataxin-like iron-binding protein CyaY
LHLLERDNEAIEREIGCSLEWEDEDPNSQNEVLDITKENVDPTNRDDWPSQHLWIAERLEGLHKAFAPRIRELDLEQEEPDDE